MSILSEAVDMSAAVRRATPALRQQMIDELLHYGWLDRIELRRTAVDMNAVVRNALDSLSAAVTEVNGAITVARLPVVPGDAPRLTRLFENLLGNALMYRHPGRRPDVRVSGRKSGQGWVFSVADNGIGIPPASLERVFQVFHRAHSDGVAPGTGMGLATCRRIAERHGGRIWAESAPGHGSVFHLRLPGGRLSSHDGAA